MEAKPSIFAKCQTEFSRPKAETVDGVISTLRRNKPEGLTETPGSARIQDAFCAISATLLSTHLNLTCTM